MAIGAIVSAGLNLLGGIIGGNKAKKAARQASDQIKKYVADLEAKVKIAFGDYGKVFYLVFILIFLLFILIIRGKK